MATHGDRVPGKGRGGAGGRKSRSGADTFQSSDIVASGGKLDPAALRRRIEGAAGNAATPPPADAPSASTPAADEGSPLSLLPPDPDRAAVTGSSDDDAPNRVVFVLQRDLQKRLDKYLTDRIPFMSRTQLQRLIDEGGVLINGKPTKSSFKVGVHDRIEVFVPPPPPTEVQPEDIPLNVLYEDGHIIVLSKPADIIVHPARAHNSGTMINALAFHFQNRSEHGGALSEVGKDFARPGVVHRLDRDTTGVIVFAKDDTSHWKLARQFETRTVDKRYIALVHGWVEPEVEVIDKPLGPHPSKEKGYREKYVVRHDYLGKPSVTICRVLARFRVPGEAVGEAKGTTAAFSIVELELKTGRTHQIRVHLSHGGYPIVGDDMYGGRPLAFGGQVLARQALHAATLSFRHPITQAPMSFAAPLPADVAAAARELFRLDSAAERVSAPGTALDLATLLPT